MHRHTQRGFTVIEVIIAVTIAGLLLAAALPSAGTWIRNTRIRTAAESISNGLQQARAEAVRRNQPVGFYLVSDAAGATELTDTCALSATSSGWVVSPASPAAKCTTDRDTFIALRPQGDTSAGLSVDAKDSASTAATAVVFNGYGQISNVSPISCVKVSNPTDAGTRRLNVAIFPGGQVRMCDPGVTDTNDPRYCVTQSGITCN
ncbi:MAG: GspH/FimT family pseudopilin, partial [Burkholderiaceae bacterium]|nr:GspH/FimT family pseudopilin [Burkholderiaceae bacterium]